MCVLPANCHTRLKIAPEQPKALRSSSSVPTHSNHSPLVDLPGPYSVRYLLTLKYLKYLAAIVTVVFIRAWLH